MEQRPLGSSGPLVSALALGCMGMSEFYGPSDTEQSLHTLRLALDLGVTFLDTADMYGAGHNETLLGQFLKGHRDQVVLATKFGIVRDPGATERRIDNSPAYVAAACEASLRRLGVETIDLYYCHRRNHETPVEDMVGAMARLVEAGKVRYLGLSEVSPDTLRAAHAVHPIAAVQSEYSLWTRDPERGILEACRALGVAFVAYSPLGRGFLTGALDPAHLTPDDFRSRHPRFRDDALARNRELVEHLRAFAQAKEATPAQVALAWILARHPHAIALFGAKRPERLPENVAALSLILTPGDVAALDALFAPEAVSGARYPEANMAGIET
ncbi:aldo/keto reductase [Pararhodospirillum oryzae]|uniref:Aldo/keto reductase n=1 Tax=Pararhodospirillum oryzae TaxID=478448 RepID=A0A512H6D2_9PROT|nr:aldo/keto reductase [Pararhodospirillum oryzae]GEO81007.1 aldo/keto reductase [Pararhodospirillum oryzae]